MPVERVRPESTNGTSRGEILGGATRVSVVRKKSSGDSVDENLFRFPDDVFYFFPFGNVECCD